jgi:dTMP kinase
MKGRFITFEGIEGSGKSTVAAAVTERLEDAGLKCVLTREPGGSETSEDIRRILLDPARTAIRPRTELLLYLASRAQLVDEVIEPALDDGITVLCDRFMDASVAYQGWARGLGEEQVEDLNRFAVGGMVPDMTFLLDLDVKEGFARGPNRREATGTAVRDRLEREKDSFHQRVREGYLRIAEREKERFVVIDASLPLSDVIEVVIRNIRTLPGLKNL